MKHTKEVAVIDRYAIHTPILYCNFFFRYATITLRKSNLPIVRYCSILIFIYTFASQYYIFRIYTFINMVKRLHSYLLLTGTLLYSAALPINAQGNTMGKVSTDSLTQDTLFSTPYLHDQVLQTVEVIGRNERSYKNTNSFIGTKTETPLKDIPQSIGYVTKELVRDQGATTVNEVVKNISGVNQIYLL